MKAIRPAWWPSQNTSAEHVPWRGGDNREKNTMALKETKPPAAPTYVDFLVGQQSAMASIAIDHMNRMVAIQEILTKGAADLSMAWVQATTAAQKEVAAMSAEAAASRDPAVAMALCQRAFEASLRHAVECSTNNMQAAKDLCAKAYSMAATPDSK